MQSKYFIDDDVVKILLKNDSSNEVWQAVFSHYRAPVIRFFEKHNNIAITDAQQLFISAFAHFVKSIREEKKDTCLNQSLYTILIEAGNNILNVRATDKILKTGKSYLAGEVLIDLIKSRHKPCFYTIFKEYEKPTMVILNCKYKSIFNVSPGEIYGESMTILKSNIENGKVQTPMTSRLFTYFYLIARNKYLQLGNYLQGITFYPDLCVLEKELEPVKSEEKYVDYIKSLWPKISYADGENVFDTLMATFNPEEQVILRMRFEKGLRFKEIGRQLGIKEGTCRKRVHYAIKKWKKQFFKHYIISEAKQACKLYLEKYLLEDWPINKIATHFNCPETEVKDKVDSFLENWRKRHNS